MDTFIQIVLVTSFLIHGVLKNLVVGGIPILMVTYYRGNYGDGNEYYRSLAKGMSELAPMTMGLAVAFGLMTWAIVRMQYDWRLAPLLGSEFLGWIVFMVLLFIGYWGVVSLKRDYHKGSGNHSAIGWLVTFCMFVITGIFVTSHVRMLASPSHSALVQTSVLTSLDYSLIWPRFFHFVLGGFAITGIVLTIYGSLRPQCCEDYEVDPAPYDTRLVRYGVGWVLGGTIPQVVVGPWFLLVLPSEVRVQLIDGTSVVSLIFFSSLTLALLALVLLNSSLMVPQKRGLVWSGAGSMLLTIVFMVLVREEVRKIWMISHGGVAGVGELSWIVVISVVTIMFVGLFMGGRYVTLSHNQTKTR